MKAKRDVGAAGGGRQIEFAYGMGGVHGRHSRARTNGHFGRLLVLLLVGLVGLVLLGLCCLDAKENIIHGLGKVCVECKAREPEKRLHAHKQPILMLLFDTRNA